MVFPADVEHNVAIKVSFWDGVAGTLKLVYHNNSGPQEKTISASGTDTIKTATFFVTAKFDATGFNYDFELHSEEEVPVSFVRVIKNEFDSVSVSGVKVSPTSLTLFVGTSGMLTETVLPSDAFKREVNWSTNDPKVATVNSSGLVSAVGVGSASITATTIDGEYTANCTITVEPGLGSQVNINNWDIEDTTSMYQDTTNSDKWTIKGFYIHENTTNVFQASESGLDPEAGVGSSQAFKVTIANSISSTSSAVVKTHIIDISDFGDGPYKFSFQTKSQSAPPGKPFWVIVKAYNADSSDVSSVSITKIDNGGTINYSGMESGYKEQSISVVLSGDTAKYLNLTIQSAKYNNTYWFDNFTLGYGAPESVPVTGVSVLPTILSLNIGSTEVLTKTVAPLEAVDKTVTWSSSNESVATVNASGAVTAVSLGSATITLTTNNGGFKDSCELTVNTPVSVASVQEARVKVYPNPLIEGELSISSNFNIENIRVFDLSGTLIQEEQNCFSRSVKMNLDHLISGMYFIQIESKQFSIFDKVLIQ
ncbi:MAG: Ig-like domain-containing protein [Bacteroidales bacterium]|nr:Ig-like domain-containing protein [Bacteroidales bacterium]